VREDNEIAEIDVTLLYGSLEICIPYHGKENQCVEEINWKENCLVQKKLSPKIPGHQKYKFQNKS
jgi:hypothetical protein